MTNTHDKIVSSVNNMTDEELKKCVRAAVFMTEMKQRYDGLPTDQHGDYTLAVASILGAILGTNAESEAHVREGLAYFNQYISTVALNTMNYKFATYAPSTDTPQ